MYAGQVYTKTGPMMAADPSGRTQMIPRYAVLAPADGATADAVRHADSTPDIRTAFDDFYRVCETLVPAGGQAALQQARAQFLLQLPADPAVAG